MSVPDFQTLMLPVLKACSGGETEKVTIRAAVAKAMALSESDLAEMLPSRKMTTYANRVAWALSYLSIAGLLERARRGVYRLTPEGEAVLQNPPPRIDMKFLDRYPAYAEWRRGSRSEGAAPVSASPSSGELQTATPEELIESNFQTLTRALEGELLERLRQVDASDFESIIIDLLIAMGYGGGKAEMGRAIGRSGDGGIDGIIREDPLGLDIVYVQAKRYGEGNTIGRPDIQGFAGSLDGVGATKGIFFATSSFTAGALEYVGRISKRIILIDGKELARLMVAHGVGVRPSTSYVIKRIDEDYFAE